MSEELVVYVDELGVPTGETAPKLAAHNAHTRLHAAFSCYIFNDQGQLLVTQRAHTKKVWPGVWTNSVCGHPAPGEKREDAITRRAQYELGMELKDLTVALPSYCYTTPPFKGVIENEFCPVFLARQATAPKPNPEEVENLDWLDWEEFMRRVEADDSDVWSYWCKDQVKQLTKLPLLKTYIS